MSSDGTGGVSLGFGDLYAAAGDHIGHFYQTREEWKELLVPFIRTGLKAGEKCVYVISPGSGRQELKEALAVTGVDVDSALTSGQLMLDEGKREPEEMQEALDRALAEIPVKFPLLRWGGDMTWSLEKVPTTEKLMEWETHCNVIENPRAVFLCQYDLTAFAGNVVMDALRTHPLCVVSNVIHQNPYFEEPEVFLERLRCQASATPLAVC